MRKVIGILAVAAAVVFLNGYADAANEAGTFEKMAKEAAVNEKGVKEITYDQFMQIRNSGEPYVLVDALNEDSFKEGHIGGSISLPDESINNESASKQIPSGANTVVYCGSFGCGASTSTAQKLSAMGYNVLDYKGGLKDWQEKGNQLVK